MEKKKNLQQTTQDFFNYSIDRPWNAHTDRYKSESVPLPLCCSILVIKQLKGLQVRIGQIKFNRPAIHAI